MKQHRSVAEHAVMQMLARVGTSCPRRDGPPGGWKSPMTHCTPERISVKASTDARSYVQVYRAAAGPIPEARAANSAPSPEHHRVRRRPELER